MPASFLRRFLADESGAVTVDWVVLTASIVGLGMAVVLTVRTGINSTGGGLANELSTTDVARLETPMNLLDWPN